MGDHCPVLSSRGIDRRSEHLGSYSAPGCSGSKYASVIVVNDDSKYDDVLEMRGNVGVINGPESQSGANSLFSLVAPKCSDGKFFSKVVASGSHVASLALIQRNKADVAAIDCITYALLQRYRPSALTGTRRLGYTYAAPAPPYITRKEQRPDCIRRFKLALSSAFANPTTRAIGQDVYLSGVETASIVNYNRIDSYVNHNDWVV